VGDAGEGAPDVFGGHDYFIRHKKNLLLPAGKRLRVNCVQSGSLASLTGLD
jgi:hypothetical protein